MAAVRISFGVILMVNSINTCLILWITGYDFEICYTYSYTHVPYISNGRGVGRGWGGRLRTLPHKIISCP